MYNDVAYETLNVFDKRRSPSVAAKLSNTMCVSRPYDITASCVSVVTSKAMFARYRCCYAKIWSQVFKSLFIISIIIHLLMKISVRLIFIIIAFISSTKNKPIEFFNKYTIQIFIPDNGLNKPTGILVMVKFSTLWSIYIGYRINK